MPPDKVAGRVAVRIGFWYTAACSLLAAGPGGGRETDVQVILTADDFGRTSGVNAAVMRGHRAGMLTGASLMVAGDAVGEAIALALATPTLAVGLHLVLVDGKAVLAHADIPHVVDACGRFRGGALGAGLRYALDRRARREALSEMEAQFERFAETRLPLSHVDGHQHMHMHPALFPHVVRLANRFGAQGVRVPRDDLVFNLLYSGERLAAKVIWAAFFRLMAGPAHTRLHRDGLSAADRVHGLLQTGRMDRSYLMRLLPHISVPACEIYFHPTECEHSVPMGPSRADLEALLDPEVRREFVALGLAPATYAGLRASRVRGRAGG